MANLNQLVGQFAAANAMHKGTRKYRTVYIGGGGAPPICTYANEHIRIYRSNSLMNPLDVGEEVADVRMAVHDPKYPTEDFKRFADKFIAACQSEFGERRVKVIFDHGGDNSRNTLQPWVWSDM